MDLDPKFRAIWEQVQENRRRLESCPGPHVFCPVDESSPAARIGRQRCSICGGETDAIHAIWYRTGLEHGKRVEVGR